MMGGWEKWGGALLMGAIVVFLWRQSKGKIIKADLSKSISSMAVLALILIGFIGLLVLFLRH